MEMQFTDLGGVTKVALEGRLDTAAVNSSELGFTAGIVSKAQPTILDLSGVTFVASLGIRMLIQTARALAGKGASMALFGANTELQEVFETAALSSIILIMETEAEALSAVGR
jgi:anti-sigma B factor antagonist